MLILGLQGLKSQVKFHKILLLASLLFISPFSYFFCHVYNINESYFVDFFQ